ncbi:MAG TPA: copper resistance protein CopC [Candidatus Limnocylindrales bacterium]|nr:copper resistance protein CopC [Candidatus Limnocylindrales bacterium]
MFHSIRPRHVLAGVALAALVAFWVPAIVAAHAELETSTPADGATVPSPFAGPIVMTFSSALADGSKAELFGSFGKLIASATVDGPGATMTIALTEPLAPATYEVKWVTVADDGDLERGTFSFTVAQASTTPSPSASPPVASATASATQATASSATTSLTPSAAPSLSPADGGASSGGGDVVIPILAALVIVGAGAVYLLGRRNRPSSR